MLAKAILVFFLLCRISDGLDNGLARTPPSKCLTSIFTSFHNVGFDRM